MGVLHGKGLRIELKTAAGAYVDVSDAFDSVDFDNKKDASESTSFADGNWQTFTDGMGSASFKADGKMVPAQYTALVAASDAVSRSVKIYPGGKVTGAIVIELSLVGMSVGLKGKNSDNIGCSCDATVTGAPIYTVYP